MELSEEEIAEIKAAREAAKKGEEEEEEEGETDDTMEEEEDEVPTTKKVTETVDEWKVLNSAKPIWTRNPKDVKDEVHMHADMHMQNTPTQTHTLTFRTMMSSTRP